jgi:phospholipid-binding lipoprotein MlaA
MDWGVWGIFLSIRSGGVPVDIWTSIAIRAGEAVNDTSLHIGEYEALKEAALDPYVMIRNAYVQNRNKLIAE